MMWVMIGLASLKLIEFVPAKIVVIVLGLIGTWYAGFHIPTKN